MKRRTKIAATTLAFAGACAVAALASSTSSIPPKPVVAFELMRCGIGADELAALGCTASNAESVLTEARTQTSTFASLTDHQAQLSTIDAQIQDAQRLYRSSRVRHADQRAVIEQRSADRELLLAQIRDLQSDLREATLVSIAAPAAIEERVTSTLPESRRLPAAWRANDNSTQRKRIVAGAIQDQERSIDAGLPIESDVASTLALEQARPDTAAALIAESTNGASVRTVFLEWIRASE